MTRHPSVQFAVLLLLIWFQSASAEEDPRVLRAGILGCDTSHVIAFTNLINSPGATGPLADVEVTIAYPGGSNDLPASRDRLPQFVAQLREKGITIVDSPEALVEQCDAILLESVDGRVHLEQFKAIAKGKPVFIDKPAAASLADVIAIFEVAASTNTPVFTSSSLRFQDAVHKVSIDKSLGKILGIETAGPLQIEPHHPDLFWYGIHGVEPLFAMLGPGCKTVVRVDSPLASSVVGKWSDGRLGTYFGTKDSKANYAITAYGSEKIAQHSVAASYDQAVREICQFFLTRKPPVSAEETIEIFAFMEAADESKQRGGEPVELAEIISRASDDLNEKN
jgi:hypothetical protein